MDNQDDEFEIVAPENQNLAPEDVTELIPSMPSVPTPMVVPQDGTASLVGDQELKDAYQGALDIMKEDREQIKDLTEKIADMVINGGDASSSAKEVLGSLLKTQTDIVDKMIKIADLKTRLKMKEQNTMPAWMCKQQQNNTINIKGGPKTARLLIDAINSERQARKTKKGTENE